MKRVVQGYITAFSVVLELGEKFPGLGEVLVVKETEHS